MRLALAAVALVVASAPAVALAAPQSGYHVDNRFGIQFKPPKGWSNIAIKTDEAWLTAKYMSDKSYFYTDKDTKYTSEQTPELLVIAFIHENMKKQKREVEENEEDGIKTTTITINNPYKDYQDFLDRTYSGGGFYIDSKETKKVGKYEVTQYVVKVEKLSRQGPKRIVTWIYHTDDIDFAFQIEVLEGEYKKLKSTIERSYKSFKEIERTEGKLPTSGSTDDGIWITIREMSEGDPKERKTKRMESQEALHNRAVARLPEDWDHAKAGDTLILTHTDKKYTKRLGDHVEAYLKWIEKTFSYIGEGEYVRAPIIRICKDWEEESSFSRGIRSGGNWWFGAASEIITHKDSAGWIGSEVDWVNMRLFGHWMADRDPDLRNAMPEWLGGGLNDYVKGARAKGRKLDFRVDDWDRDGARLAVAQGRATPPRELIKMTREEFADSGAGANASTYWGRRAEASMFVRFLMSPEANKCKQSKDFLETYLTTLKMVITEIEEEEKDTFKADKEPETEEEEDEQAKARAERWRQREKELMEQLYFRVFRDWTDKDWKEFEKAYFDFIG